MYISVYQNKPFGGLFVDSNCPPQLLWDIQSRMKYTSKNENLFGMVVLQRQENCLEFQA